MPEKYKETGLRISYGFIGVEMQPVHFSNQTVDNQEDPEERDYTKGGISE